MQNRGRFTDADAKDPLRPGLTPERARDILLLLTGPQIYAELDHYRHPAATVRFSRPRYRRHSRQTPFIRRARVPTVLRFAGSRAHGLPG